MSEVFRHLARVERNAALVRNAKLFGHRVTADWDRDRTSRSPTAAAWKAHCSCGWESSKFHYGEAEALASAIRHLKQKGLST